MKKVTLYVRDEGYSKGTGQSFELDYTTKLDYTKEFHLAHYDTLVGLVKKEYPKAEFVEVKLEVSPSTVGFTKNKLLEIGQEVASGWGAVCTGVKCFKNSVQFNCNEFGEKFTTLMTHDEIKQEYARML